MYVHVQRLQVPHVQLFVQRRRIVLLSRDVRKRCIDGPCISLELEFESQGHVGCVDDFDKVLNIGFLFISQAAWFLWGLGQQEGTSTNPSLTSNPLATRCTYTEMVTISGSVSAITVSCSAIAMARENSRNDSSSFQPHVGMF